MVKVTAGEKHELAILRATVQLMRERTAALPEDEKGVIMRFCRELPPPSVCVCGIHLSYVEDRR